MGVAGSPTRIQVAALVLLLVLVPGTATAFDGYDGMPRPRGMDGTPMTTLGATPAVKYDGQPADCIWYAWENFHYSPNVTSNCSTMLWASLSEADPATLEGFKYYAPLGNEFYDAAYDEHFCAIGCFDLAATGGPSPAPETSPSPVPETSPSPVPETSPSPASLPPNIAPPPVDTQPPSPSIVSPPSPPVMTAPPPAIVPPPSPPVMAAPPPAIVPPPSPPVMAAPPPATLFRPPPPSLPQPPTSIVTPPTGTPSEAQAPGPGLGPVAQTAAGSVLRLNSGSSLFVYVAAVFLSIGLTL